MFAKTTFIGDVITQAHASAGLILPLPVVMERKTCANSGGQALSSFSTVYLSLSNAEERGPGVLTVGQSEILWTSRDDSLSEWNLRFDEVNLHAIGTEETINDNPNNCKGYVLVQHGSTSEEVRFSSTDRDILVDIYKAFCEGVARCPAADDESTEDGDLANTLNTNEILDRMDALISQSLRGEHSHVGEENGNNNTEDNEGQDRWIDADESDSENAENGANTNKRNETGFQCLDQSTESK